MSGEEKPIRAFVALELPEPVRRALHAVIDVGLPDARAKLAWVSPESTHLTLAFLGASEPARLRELQSRLAAIASARAPFALELSGPGVFPSPRKPAVLWIGVRESPELMTLQAAVASACRELGWELDARPFHPHLTCARVKFAGAPGALAAAWSKVAPPAAGWNVDALSLMRSDTRPEGAVYTALAELKLG